MFSYFYKMCVLYIKKTTISNYLTMYMGAILCISFCVLPLSSNTVFDPEIDLTLVYSPPI